MHLTFDRPACLDQMRSGMYESVKSYFQNETLPAELVQRMFQAVTQLRAIPVGREWVTDTVIRIDVPEISVLGYNLAVFEVGGGFGLLTMLRPRRSHGREVIDEEGNKRVSLLPVPPEVLGIEAISVELVRKDFMPKKMLQEAEEHGWEPTPDGLYPVYWRSDIDPEVGTYSLEVAHFQALIATIEAVIKLDQMRPDIFRGEHLSVPFELEITANGGESVFMGYPAGLHEVRQADMECWASEQRMLAYSIVFGITNYYGNRKAREWAKYRWLSEEQSAFPFSQEWLVFRAKVGGQVPIDAFLADRREYFSERQLAMIEVQRHTELRVWEMMTMPDEDLMVTVRDVESGEEKRIPRIDLGLAWVVPGHMFLARIMDFEGTAFMSGRAMVRMWPELARKAITTAKDRMSRGKDDRIEYEKNLFRSWIEHAPASQVRPIYTEYVQEFDPETADKMELIQDFYMVPPEGFSGLARTLRDMDSTVKCYRTKRKGEMTFDAEVVLDGADEDDVWKIHGSIHGNHLRIDALNTETADKYQELLREAIPEGGPPLLRQFFRWEATKSANPNFTPMDFLRLLGPGGVSTLVKDRIKDHYEEWADEPCPEYDGLSRRQALADDDYRDEALWELRQTFFLENLNPEEEQRFDMMTLRSEMERDAEKERGKRQAKKK